MGVLNKMIRAGRSKHIYDSVGNPGIPSLAVSLGKSAIGGDFANS